MRISDWSSDVCSSDLGCPVLACSNDTWAAVAGLGALRPGYAYNISGTTEVFGAIGAEPVQAQGLMTVDWGNDHHQIGGPGQNGADTVAWILPLLGRLGDEGIAAVPEDMKALLHAPRDPPPASFPIGMTSGREKSGQ